MAEGNPSLSLILYRLDGPGGGCDLVEIVIVEELRPDLQHQDSEAQLQTHALQPGRNPRF